MQKFQIVELNNKMHVLGSLSGEKIVYAVAKNAKLIGASVKEIQREVQSLQIKHTKHDDNGNIVLDKDGNAEFNNGYNFQRDFEALMEEDFDIVLYKVKKEFVPASITVEQANVMMEFIEE